jgi:hypothetical protein
MVTTPLFIVLPILAQKAALEKRKVEKSFSSWRLSNVNFSGTPTDNTRYCIY